METEFLLFRTKTSAKTTLGELYAEGSERMCYTLENGFQPVKVWGESRIPEGRYQLALRKHGKFYDGYKVRLETLMEKNGFPRINHFPGVIELLGVPNFSDILIHAGNYFTDTKGCILPGLNYAFSAAHEYHVLQSFYALSQIYPPIAGAILSGPTFLRITDSQGLRHKGLAI